jgi:hypothetical protein
MRIHTESEVETSYDDEIEKSLLKEVTLGMPQIVRDGEVNSYGREQTRGICPAERNIYPAIR